MPWHTLATTTSDRGFHFVDQMTFTGDVVKTKISLEPRRSTKCGLLWIYPPYIQQIPTVLVVLSQQKPSERGPHGAPHCNNGCMAGYYRRPLKLSPVLRAGAEPADASRPWQEGRADGFERVSCMFVTWKYTWMWVSLYGLCVCKGMCICKCMSVDIFVCMCKYVIICLCLFIGIWLCTRTCFHICISLVLWYLDVMCEEVFECLCLCICMCW